MKKILFGIVLSLVCLTSNAYAMNCDGGNVLTTPGGAKFCVNRVTTNWFSAVAWCDSLDLELADLKDICSTNEQAFDEEVPLCPALVGSTFDSGRNANISAWTATAFSDSIAYYVDLSSGAFYNTSCQDQEAPLRSL